MGQRSIWKGPFVDVSILKQIEVVNSGSKNKKVIKTHSRRSTILPNFVGLTFEVYNGKKNIPIRIIDSMVGKKLGEFSPTRSYYGHGANKKARRG